MTETRKKALICYLGGTIGMVRGPDGVLHPAANADEFKRAVKKVTDSFPDVDFEFVTLSTKDSSDLGPEEWEEFIAYVNYRQKDFDFIVCPHGTDTMAYTASAFSYGFFDTQTHKSALFVPVIFTGSQKPMGEIGSDAEKNLVSAIQTGIKADRDNITDVLIAFDNRIVRGVKAYKTTEKNYDAFDSVDGIHIGVVNVHGVHFTNEQAAIHTDASIRTKMATTYDSHKPPPNGKFMIAAHGENIQRRDKGYLINIRIEPGISEEALLSNAERPNCLGIIMPSLGAGNIPANLIPALSGITGRYHIPIFSISPFVGGSACAAMYEAGQRGLNAGVSFLNDQPTSAAWVKAHWLLANGLAKTPSDFIRNMQRIWVGEGAEYDAIEILPPIYENLRGTLKTEFAKRANHCLHEVNLYRKEKGQKCRLITVPAGQNPVLPPTFCSK